MAEGGPEVAELDRRRRAASRATCRRASRSRIRRTARYSWRVPGGAGWTAHSAFVSICRSIPAQPRKASSVSARYSSRSASATPSRRSDSSIDSSGESRGPLEPAQLGRQPAQPGSDRPRVAVQARERAEEPGLASGERPAREPLVEEGGAEPDEHLVDQTGRCPGRWPCSSRSRWRSGSGVASPNRLHAVDAVVADAATAACSVKDSHVRSVHRSIVDAPNWSSSEAMPSAPCPAASARPSR